MTTTRAFEVVLSIPDNEALTALATLQRLGIDVADLKRADLWRFKVDSSDANDLPERLRGLETVFNPNKHRLRERASAAPESGEVWIDEAAPPGRRAGGGTVAGREVRGVRQAERLVSWRLFDRHGKPALAEVVDRAVETLLCNPAFQRAIR